MTQIELLAPAGSYEAFEAAIGAGADAVYVGGNMFGARAYAKNFGQEELLKAIRTAHIHGKKLYLTVNTLLKNREINKELYQYLLPFYEAGLDAVIVQDMGVFRFIRRNFPDLPIHASTQMTITGPKGMKFLEECGADRVVAARELSLEEISQMYRESGIEIEAFVHGALCYSLSGQCLMSSLFGGRSGNRGRCAQPCRLPYQVSEDGKRFSGGKELCPLSLKDMCTLDILPAILEAGVVSLKIEGRMKQPGYTAGVTAMYRKYLDLLNEKGSAGYSVEEKDRRYLLDIFNRGGSCQGYYKQHNGPSMMAFTNEKKTSGNYGEIRKRKEKIYGNLILFPGSPAILEVSCREVSVTVSEGEVQFAKNQPMEEARIRQQMEKLGGTEFEWQEMKVEMDDHIFIPVKVLNELRRNALKQMEEALCGKYCRKAQNAPSYEEKCRDSKEKAHKIYVSCRTIEQALELCDHADVFGMYLNFDAMKACMDKGICRTKELFLTLPHLTRGSAPDGYFEQAQKWLEQGMKGFLVRNLESYAMLRELGYAKKCVLDASMYTWNDEAAAFWREQGILKNTMPLELNEKELKHRDHTDSELMIYGYHPLMTSAQCVKKNCFQCDRNQGKVWLKDRYDKIFPSVCFCHPWKMETTGKREFCYNIIYNTIPYGLLYEKKQAEAIGAGSYRLDFTVESPMEAKKILHAFADVYLYDREPSDFEFTKGHFKRGAE